MNFHPRNFRKKFKSFEFGISFWKTIKAGRMEREEMEGCDGQRREWKQKVIHEKQIKMKLDIETMSPARLKNEVVDNGNGAK